MSGYSNPFYSNTTCLRLLLFMFSSTTSAPAWPTLSNLVLRNEPSFTYLYQHKHTLTSTPYFQIGIWDIPYFLQPHSHALNFTLPTLPTLVLQTEPPLNIFTTTCIQEPGVALTRLVQLSKGHLCAYFYHHSHTLILTDSSHDAITPVCYNSS